MPTSTQLHVTKKETGMITPHTWNPIVNGQLMSKPSGGLWTSTYIDGNVGSAWVQQLYDMGWLEDGDKIDTYVLEPTPKANVYTVDSLADMHWLYDTYGYELIPGQQRWIDFERMAKEWDAVHLTQEGQWRTRFAGGLSSSLNPDYDPNRSPFETFYGWDCESTIWLRWSFQTVAYVGKKSYGRVNVY